MYLRTLGGALLLGLVACSASTNEGDSQNAAESSATSPAIDPRSPIAGQEWARCWFVDSASGADLVDYVCRRTASLAGYPYSFGHLYAYPTDPRIPTFLPGANGDTNTLEPSTPVGLHVMRTRIPRAAFPLDATTSVSLYPFVDTASHAIPRITPYGDLQGKQRLLGPVTEQNPVILKQPFDLWPIRIVNLTRNGFQLSVDAYGFNVAPMTLGSGPVEAQLDEMVSFNGTENLFLPAPTSASLHATIAPRTAGVSTAGAATSVTFDRPGIYIYEESGLRPATDAEIAQLEGH